MTSSPNPQAHDPLLLQWRVTESAHYPSHKDAYVVADIPGATFVVIAGTRNPEFAAHIVKLHNDALAMVTDTTDHFLMLTEQGWTVLHSQSCRDLGIEHMAERCLANLVVRAVAMTEPQSFPGPGKYRIVSAQLHPLRLDVEDAQ
jgi:hypothetical protein